MVNIKNEVKLIINKINVTNKKSKNFDERKRERERRHTYNL